MICNRHGSYARGGAERRQATSPHSRRPEEMASLPHAMTSVIQNLSHRYARAYEHSSARMAFDPLLLVPADSPILLLYGSFSPPSSSHVLCSCSCPARAAACHSRTCLPLLVHRNHYISRRSFDNRHKSDHQRTYKQTAVAVKCCFLTAAHEITDVLSARCRAGKLIRHFYQTQHLLDNGSISRNSES